MKIAPLLAQYLYQQKSLDLPGIGRFLLDPSAQIHADYNNSNKIEHLEGVTFINDPTRKETPDLIQFISSQTGKIKALASADLASFLGLAQQFINIGKPFLFEGIGSLYKLRSGEYQFTPGHAIAVSLKDASVKEEELQGETVHDYKSIFYPKKATINWKKPLVAFLLLGGLGLAAWVGYYIYQKTNSQNTMVASESMTIEEPVLSQDKALPTQKDTGLAPVHTATGVPGNVKVILETALAKRAFSRYRTLKNFQWNVQLETKDSLSYKLYMLLPANAIDTTRILDSLTRLNGKRVYIE